MSDDFDDLLNGGNDDAAENNLALALRLAAQGFPVFPCREVAETRMVRGALKEYKEKTPYTSRGFKNASTDSKQIHRWWKATPDALVGMPTGAASGFAVLDLDVHDQEKNGIKGIRSKGYDPETISPILVTTGSGGIHAYFKHREGISNSDRHLPAGVDVRAEGGYVIAPGSRFPDGRCYSSVALTLNIPDFPSDLMPAERGPRDNAFSKKTRMGLSVDDIRQYAEEYPNAPEKERHEWVADMASFHHEATAPDENGEYRTKREQKEICEIALAWTAKNSKYSTEGHLKEAERDFWSFKADSHKDHRTFAYITSTVREMRRESDLDDEFDDLGDEEQSDDADDFDSLLNTRIPVVKKAKAKPKVPAWDDPALPKHIRYMNRRHAVVRFNAKTYIVDMASKDSDEIVSLGDEKSLHLAYAPKKIEVVTVDKSSKKETTKDFTWSQLWIANDDRRFYPRGICFNPKEDEEGRLNLWKGFTVEPDPNGRCDLLINHIHKILCNGNKAHSDAFLDFMAHMIQKPWERPTFSVVMRGAMGAGKDTPFTYLGMMFPAHYITVGRNADISGRFNGHLMGKILVHLQEGFYAGNREQQNYMKFLLSSTKINIENKGVNIFTIVARHRTVISSNEDWVAPASWGERRYFVLDVENTFASGTSDESAARNKAYFDAIEQQMMRQGGLGAFFHFLMTRDISSFDTRRPPRTEALARQVIEGLQDVSRWWYDVLESGCIDASERSDTAMRTVWERDWITKPTDDVYDAYERWRTGKRFRAEPVSRAKFAREIRRLCPRMMNKQLRYEKLGDRVRSVSIPNLAQCRKDFDGLLGNPIDWDEIFDADGDEAEV